ncbi:hypothetical protein A2U01_0098042, partial [Trifolium medium]|nr:hypothetical protein [Trifolium medium]
MPNKQPPLCCATGEDDAESQRGSRRTTTAVRLHIDDNIWKEWE